LITRFRTAKAFRKAGFPWIAGRSFIHSGTWAGGCGHFVCLIASPPARPPSMTPPPTNARPLRRNRAADFHSLFVIDVGWARSSVDPRSRRVPMLGFGISPPANRNARALPLQRSANPAAEIALLKAGSLFCEHVAVTCQGLSGLVCCAIVERRADVFLAIAGSGVRRCTTASTLQRRYIRNSPAPSSPSHACLYRSDTGCSAAGSGVRGESDRPSGL